MVSLALVTPLPRCDAAVAAPAAVHQRSEIPLAPGTLKRALQTFLITILHLMAKKISA